jgi:hypothetical protein
MLKYCGEKAQLRVALARIIERASKGSGLFDSVASATVGLVPTCRNRFGVLDGAGSRPNLLRSLGLRPLNAGAFLGLDFGSTPNLLRS